MADRALGVAGVLFDELAHGQRGDRRFFVRQRRHALGRTGQAVAKQHLADPVSTQDRAGARGAGLLGERGRLGQNSAAHVLLHAVHAPPLGADHAGDAIVFCQILVQKRVVGGQDVRHRAIVLNQVGEEADRFFIHCATEANEPGARNAPAATHACEATPMGAETSGKCGCAWSWVDVQR